MFDGVSFSEWRASPRADSLDPGRLCLPGVRAGVRVNDVIVAVQDQPVVDAEDLERALERIDLAQGVRLTLTDGSVRRFAFLRSQR